MYLSNSWIGVAFGRRTMLSGTVWCAPVPLIYINQLRASGFSLLKS